MFYNEKRRPLLHLEVHHNIWDLLLDLGEVFSFHQNVVVTPNDCNLLQVHLPIQM